MQMYIYIYTCIYIYIYIYTCIYINIYIVGETFLNLVKRHFNNNHRYHKIFNKNNIKVSYNCMKNMYSIIKQHNSHITKKQKSCVRTCNCSNKSKFPLGNKCLANILFTKQR